MVIKGSWGNVCLQALPEDSQSFGHSLAVNENYLVVGDPQNNQVVIYGKGKLRWNRIQIIKPPVDSNFNQVGFGFGHSLSLSDSNLIIGAYAFQQHPPSYTITPPPQQKRIEEKYFQVQGDWGSHLGSIYEVDLNDPSLTLVRIDQPLENQVYGQVIASDGGIIAFDSKTRDIKLNKWKSQIHLLSAEGLITIDLPLPKNQEDQSYLITDIDIKGDRLIVGSTVANNWEIKESYAWLFNIKQWPEKPQQIIIPKDNGGPLVEISSSYIVVGTTLTNRTSLYEPPKIFIYDLEGNRQNIISGEGEISLENNFLIKKSSNYYDSDNPSNLMEIFRLGDSSDIDIIKNRRNIKKAILENGFLVTVSKDPQQTRLCIQKFN